MEIDTSFGKLRILSEKIKVKICLRKNYLNI